MKLLDELYKSVDNLSIFDDDCNEEYDEYDTESIIDLINEKEHPAKKQPQPKPEFPFAVTTDGEGKIGEFRHGLVSKLLEKFIIIFTAGTFYLYNEEYGYYVEHDEDYLNARIEEEFEDPA